jgi:hypothetical protein
MADIQLTQVAILSKEDHKTMTGGAHYHIFRNLKDGSILLERTTAEHHALQKQKGGSVYNPKKDGYEWVATYGDHEYDTPSGRLEANTYAIDGSVALVKTEYMGQLQSIKVPATDIVDGKITTEKVQVAIDKIVKESPVIITEN